MFPVRSAGLWLGTVLALALVLTACSANGPQLIGAQPKQIGSSGYSPPNWPIVYSAYMEMEVADVGAAVRAAVQIAHDYGGYLADADERSFSDGRYVESSTICLSIPAAEFDGAHNALLGLGRLIREDISGRPLGGAPGEDLSATLSNITVHFQLTPRSTWRPRPSIGWNPARTFEQAFAWAVSIFTFLADIVIWLVVVGGPFVLMGWGVVALLRRLRGKR